jgi:hypothetical protein
MDLTWSSFMQGDLFMDKDRFHYLFKCYKCDLLSARDFNDWQDLVRDEQYRGLIVSDIECRMNQLLFSNIDMATVPENSWANILTAIRPL